MKRFIKRVCFVVPMALLNIVDDLVFLFSLGYAGWLRFGMWYSIWWFKKGFGQY